MKQITHYQLGQYLGGKLLGSFPSLMYEAFLLGCTQPDHNPFTYVKGSFRGQWFRGHNWHNSKRYIRRLINRLELKESLHVLDFYALGKLIHYIADAFTYAHNASFSGNLQSHRKYESELHNYVADAIKRGLQLPIPESDSLFSIVRSSHQRYCRCEQTLQTDAQFAVSISTIVLERLLLPHKYKIHQYFMVKC